MSKSFDAMVAISTQNQIVNFVPALMLGVKEVFLLESPRSLREGWGDRLKDIAKKRNIKVKGFRVEDSYNIHDLKENFSSLFSSLSQKENVCINYSGGQKPLAFAVYDWFEEKFPESWYVYMEGNGKTLYLSCGEKREEILIDVDVTLEEILELYGYSLQEGEEIEWGEIFEDDSYQKAKRMGELYKDEELFQKVFLAVADKVEMDFSEREVAVKKALERLKPNIENITIEGDETNKYVQFDKLMRNQKSKTLSSFGLEYMKKNYCDIGDLYNQFWTAVKKQMVKYVMEELQHVKKSKSCSSLGEYDVKIEGFSVKDYNKLVNWFNECGVNAHWTEIEAHGKKRYFLRKSDVVYFDKIGTVFEKMVLAEVCSLLQENEKLQNKVKHLYVNVKTRRKETGKSVNDAEYDIVLVTSYGTLVVLEVKAGPIAMDTARGKEHGVHQKSGPYGRALVVGALLSSFDNINENAGKRIFVPNSLRDQKENCEKSGVSYVFFDKIGDVLSGLL